VKMNIFVIYSIIIIFVLSCICSGILGYQVGKRDRLSTVIVQYEGHKISLWNALNKVDIYPTDEQKVRFEKIIKSYNKKPMGF
jgi:hypothetical protein